MTTSSQMRIGILTGGGDAPGLNGIIESATRALTRAGAQVIGVLDGFEGVLHGRTIALTVENTAGAHARSGTLLGSSNKTGLAGREVEFHEGLKKLNLDGLIACGGDGTFAGLYRVHEGLKLIGVPKTIDNDLAGTEVTFGFDTACACVADNLNRLRYTAAAHARIFVIETMGRTAGWIALAGGLSGYADAILLPERSFRRANLLEFVRQKQREGRRELMIVVSEGAVAEGERARVLFEVADSPQRERYGGIGFALARWLEGETKWEARHSVLGHLQRAWEPTAADRLLTSAMGVEAARLALGSAWGQAVVYRNGRVTHAPLDDLMKPARLVDSKHPWVLQAQALGIFI